MGEEVRVSYDLPRFDDWQAGPDPEWRLQLDADAYVDTVPVGRDVFLTGRVSWRTMPHLPDAEGWHHGTGGRRPSGPSACAYSHMAIDEAWRAVTEFAG